MNRRQVLAAGSALLPVVLAGCADPRAVLILNEPSDDEIIEKTPQPIPPDRSQDTYALVETAVTDGPATETGTRPSLDADRPVAFEDAYYQLSRSATQVGALVEFAIHVREATGSPDADDTIAFDALPAVDQDLLDQIVPPPDEDDDRPPVAETVYEDETIDDSVLVLDLEYEAVSRDGRRYPLEKLGMKTIPRNEYHYEATQIAATDADFLEWVRSTYQFELSGLSDAERDIVTEAIEEGYYEGSATDPFNALVDRFYTHQSIDHDEWGGEWLLTYRGTEYWANLDHPPRDVDA